MEQQKNSYAAMQMRALKYDVCTRRGGAHTRWSEEDGFNLFDVLSRAARKLAARPVPPKCLPGENAHLRVGVFSVAGVIRPPSAVSPSDVKFARRKYHKSGSRQDCHFQAE